MDAARLAVRLHAAGEVDRVSPQVVRIAIAADDARDDRTRVQADAEAGGQLPARRQLVERPDELEGEVRHGLHVIGPGVGKPGDGHPRVTDRLDLLDPVGGRELVEAGEDLVEEFDDLPGGAPTRELREARHVGEEDGDVGVHVGDDLRTALESLGDRVRQDDVQEPFGPLAFPGQIGVGLLERGEGGVALEEPRVRLGVHPHACGEFDGIGKLDEVVGRPAREQFGLHRRFLDRREDDHRHVDGLGQGAEASHHLGPLDVRHDEILQDDRRPEGDGGLQGRGRIAPELHLHVRLPGEHPLHRDADERLIVHDEHAMPRADGCGGATGGNGAHAGLVRRRPTRRVPP